jgi:hypothetical protein
MILFIPIIYFTQRRTAGLDGKLQLPYYCIVIISVGRVASQYSDWLRAGRSGDRIPVGARLFAQVQTDPGAHLATCTLGTGSFPGVKRPGRCADHPLPSSAKVKND